MMLVNVDARYSPPTPDQVRAAGFTGVRLVSHQGIEPYVQACQDAGLAVLAMVGSDSGGYVWGGPDIWQFGNEPDGTGPASWTMTTVEYRDNFNFYQATYPDLVWIAAGLVSGITSYWQQIQNLGGLHGVAGFDVHPYNKTAAEAKALLTAYKAITPNLGLWVTEWNRPAAECADFAAMLRLTAVSSAWFAWSDAMDPGFGINGKQRLLNLW